MISWKTLFQGLRPFACLLVGAASPTAFAHPVTWAGGSIVETDAKRGTAYDSTALRYLYSTSASLAGGISWKRGYAALQNLHLREDRILAHANARFLRLNFPNAQANGYLLGGFGGRATAPAAQTSERVFPGGKSAATDWHPTGTLGLQFDAEDLTRYSALRIEASKDQGGQAQTNSLAAYARLGLLPYEPEANELAGWLMVETSAAFGREGGRKLSPAGRWDLLPGARVFYRNFLTEVFFPVSGGMRFLLMYHY